MQRTRSFVHVVVALSLFAMALIGGVSATQSVSGSMIFAGDNPKGDSGGG